MKDLYKFLATVMVTVPAVSSSQVEVPPLSAQFLPVVEQFEGVGVDMSYARKRIAFLETRVADKNYPLPFKTAQESAECAITVTVHTEQRSGKTTPAAEELELKLLAKFCKIDLK